MVDEVRIALEDVNSAFRLAARLNGGKFEFCLTLSESAYNRVRSEYPSGSEDYMYLGRQRMVFDHTRLDAESALRIIESILTQGWSVVDLPKVVFLFDDDVETTFPRTYRIPRPLLHCRPLIPDIERTTSHSCVHYELRADDSHCAGTIRALIVAVHRTLTRDRALGWRECTSILVPVSAHRRVSNRQGLALGNLSSGLVHTIHHGDDVEQVADQFMERARQLRVAPLRRLETSGRRSARLRAASVALARLLRLPQESAVVSGVLHPGENIRADTELWFELPPRCRGAIAFGLLHAAEGIRLSATGDTDKENLRKICGTILRTGGFKFRELKG